MWSPFGTPHAIIGTALHDARFPGQWFQLEASLHNNWHRHYDPSLGRYTQPDPLGFVDGPSVYAYAKNSPQMFVDPDGQDAASIGGFIGGYAGRAVGAASPIPGGSHIGGFIGSRVGSAIGAYCMASHNKGKRASTKPKHESVDARRSRDRDRGGEKGDARRRPPRKRPPGHKGSWPPK